jgi:hypothetical protein
MDFPDRSSRQMVISLSQSEIRAAPGNLWRSVQRARNNAISNTKNIPVSRKTSESPGRLRERVR